jgi:hypothetical protein
MSVFGKNRGMSNEVNNCEAIITPSCHPKKKPGKSPGLLFICLLLKTVYQPL